MKTIIPQKTKQFFGSHWVELQREMEAVFCSYGFCLAKQLDCEDFASSSSTFASWDLRCEALHRERWPSLKSVSRDQRRRRLLGALLKYHINRWRGNAGSDCRHGCWWKKKIVANYAVLAICLFFFLERRIFSNLKKCRFSLLFYFIFFLVGNVFFASLTWLEFC